MNLEAFSKCFNSSFIFDFEQVKFKTYLPQKGNFQVSKICDTSGKDSF